MSDRTDQEPLVPIEVDLRGFPFMPLDVVRLRDSTVVAMENAEAFRSNVLSWCVSWHQIPAASLPDDDSELCRLLGYGRDIRLWKKVRAAGGLHGWIRCSDGRLYHPVVADKAMEAWNKRKMQAARTRLATAARKRAAFGRNDEHASNRYDDVTMNTQAIVTSTNRQERESRGQEKERKKDAASAAADAAPNFENGHDPPTPETELFVRGKAVLGKNAGGLIAKLIKAKGGKLQLARAVIETADTKQNPREYIGRVIAGNERSSLDYDPAL